MIHVLGALGLIPMFILLCKKEESNIFFNLTFVNMEREIIEKTKSLTCSERARLAIALLRGVVDVETVVSEAEPVDNDVLIIDCTEEEETDDQGGVHHRVHHQQQLSTTNQEQRRSDTDAILPDLRCVIDRRAADRRRVLEERRRRQMRSRHCYRCRRKGHLAASCVDAARVRSVIVSLDKLVVATKNN